jgi:alpha-glucosidase (family GH31 glycosyl hydrolase)
VAVGDGAAGERETRLVQDWYFFGYGHDYKQALGDFVRVAGRIPLPPRFAFGVWWSRYWAYTDQELDELVRGFRENDTPLDVLVIDMDWHMSDEQLKAMGEKDQSGYELGWTRLYVEQGAVSRSRCVFEKAARGWAEDDDESASGVGHSAVGAGVSGDGAGDGIDPATKKYIPFDPTDKKWATNYLDLVLHPLEKQGVDFWWLDWQQQPLTTNLPGVKSHVVAELRALYRSAARGQAAAACFIAGAGWAIIATRSDFRATRFRCGSRWRFSRGLRRRQPTWATRIWSHDIGGHMPGAVDPELYTRWVQFGAFSPILRTHTTKNPDSERRIWAYPEPYSAVMRSAYQLREAMQPYLYTEARRTYDTGVAFFRPLYYDWPEDDAAYTSKNEYMFGDQMM